MPRTAANPGAQTLLPPGPIDPAECYALMGADALLAHIEAAAVQLERCGVTLSAEARRGLDEIADCVIEHAARTDPDALRRHAAKALAALHRSAS